MTLLNDNVDLPKLEEDEERKLMDQLYSATLEALTKVLDRI